MGERTQYQPRTFCWADLTTTDQGAAVQDPQSAVFQLYAGPYDP